jgi:hypothetical protein
MPSFLAPGARKRSRRRGRVPHVYRTNEEPAGGVDQNT